MGREQLRQALRAGDLLAVQEAVSGQEPVALEDAAAIVVLVAARDPRRFESTAIRWLSRYAFERRPGLSRLDYACRVLQALGRGQGGAGAELLRLAGPSQSGVSISPPGGGGPPPAPREAVAVSWRAEHDVVYDPGGHRWHRPDCDRRPVLGGEPLGAGEVLRFINAPSSCSSCRPQVDVALTATGEAPVRDRSLRPAASPPSRRRATSIKQGRMPGR